MAAVSGVLFSLGEWDTAQGELTDPLADGPRPAINRAVCDAYATSLGASVINAGVGAAQFAIGEFCRPYYDDIGAAPPALEPPFQGGQCPVAYEVRLFNQFGGSVRFNPDSQPGPYSNFRLTRTAVSSTTENVNARLTDGNGNDISASRVGVPKNWEYSIQFTRDDGQPDDCGDPPGEFTPSPNYPTPRPTGSPTTINLGGNDVDVVISSPRVDRKGDVYVTVEGPGFEIDFPVEGPTDIVRPPEVVTGSPVDVTGDSGRQADDLTPEEQGEGFETIGYRFDLLGLPSNISGVPGTDPQVLTTPYGNVQLEYRTEGGLILFSDNLPIRVVSGSIVRQDTNLKVEAVRYQKRPDVSTIRLTPVRARIV